METEEPLSDDEKLLIRFQTAKLTYEDAAMRQQDNDCELEHAYIRATLALENLEDRLLRDLAADVMGGGNRAFKAERELLNLSRRVRDLYPNFSTLIH